MLLYLTNNSMQYKIAHVSVTDWDKLLTVFVAIICYGLGPSVGTWVLPITHGTWRSSLSGKKGNRHFENRSDENLL